MKKVVAFILCCVMACALTACGKDKDNDNKVVLEAEEDVNYPVEIGDAVVTEQPNSVVSLSPSLTEIIFDLGYGDKLGGVSEFCNYPEEALELEQLGNAKTIDFDEMENIRPDVVFTSTELADLDQVKLEEMGATVVYIPPVEDFQDVFAMYDSICMVIEGETTGKENAEDKYRDIKDKLINCEESIADYLETGAEKVTAAYVAKPKYTVATGDSFIGDAMEYVSLSNVANEFESWVFPEGEAFSPQLLIYSQDLPKEKVREYYSATPAIANGFLYTLNTEVFERQGFRMINELIEIAKYAYSGASFQQEEQEQPEEETPEMAVEQPAQDSAE